MKKAILHYCSKTVCKPADNFQQALIESTNHSAVLLAKKFWEQGQNSHTLKTSGSTGKPKSIVFARQQIVSSAKLTLKTFNLSADDKFLLCINATMVAGFMMAIRAFVNNSPLYVTEPVANPYNELPQDLQPDFIAVVPLQLEHMLAAGQEIRRKLYQTKAIIVGGAAVSADLEHMVKLMQLNAWHTYGMTETLTHVAIRKIGYQDYFEPLEGVKVRTDDRNCLVIETPVLNNKTVVTNDIAEINEHGHFKILGRIDNVINSGGYKVQAEKVEKALLQVMPKVHNATPAEVIVIASPHTELGWQVHAVVAMQGQLKEEELQQALQKELHPYEVPKKFTTVNELPRNKSGKIDRHLLFTLIMEREQQH